MNLHFLRAGDVELAAWEWPGADPPLLFAHAAGFHGRCWDHIIHLFPGRRSLAIEFRGHGRSAKPASPIPWRHFTDDVIAVADHFGIRDAIGIGHSMGGHAVAEAAALRPELFGALVLVDPVIFPPFWYSAPPPDASFIARRRNRWASPAEMLERFRSRPPFAAWRPEVLKNYCDYGLLPDGDGYVLACPPQIEAAIYGMSNAPESDIYPQIATIRLPVTILRAGAIAPPGVFDLAASPTAPDLVSKFRNAREVFLPDNNHYIPMEAPELVAKEIADSAA